MLARSRALRQARGQIGVGHAQRPVAREAALAAVRAVVVGARESALPRWSRRSWRAVRRSAPTVGSGDRHGPGRHGRCGSR